MKDIEIQGRRIGPGQPVYVVAEMSSNHNQDFDTAAELVKEAKRVGADAIKLQTATPEALTLESERPEFLVSGGTPWDGQTLFSLYERVCMPWEWQPRLKTLANELGLDCFSTPYSHEAVDFLERMDVPAYKVASFELAHIPLIEYVAQKKKPMIISTGLSQLAEIHDALQAAKRAGATQIALLKCNSGYPAPPEEMNLRTISHMASTFDVPVGLSDHTMGPQVAVASVALGACIIEKHLTLSRETPTPDASFSMEPEEFKEMVSAVRLMESTLGEVHYGPTPKEAKSLTFRRSLFVVKDILESEVFTTENVRLIRPGHGLHPRFLKEVLGRRAAKDIERGTPLDWSLVGGT